jgi:hypothetical protein
VNNVLKSSWALSSVSVELKADVSEISHMAIIRVDPGVDMDMKISENWFLNKMLTRFYYIRMFNIAKFLKTKVRYISRIRIFYLLISYLKTKKD